jgi:hypothetical protein
LQLSLLMLMLVWWVWAGRVNVLLAASCVGMCAGGQEKESDFGNAKSR